MSRLLVLGYTLPSLISPENTVVPRAFNLRTAQFVDALLQAGHQLLVCCYLHPGETVPAGLYPLNKDNLRCVAAGPGSRAWLQSARQEFHSFHPDALVAVSLLGCLVASQLPGGKPLWCDIYGDPITDLQMLLSARGYNRGLRSVLWLESVALRRGDAFSTCSNPQRCALIGKLSSLLRLDYRTLEYQFVHAIPPAFVLGGAVGSRKVEVYPQLWGSGPFNVLWYGGYNGWADVDTLFEALEYAMEHDERIHYTSLGEGIADPSLYQRFAENVRRSQYADRYHLLGWRPSSELREFIAKSHLGISVLRNIYETELGAPTRLLEMLSLGLPVLTVGSELSGWLASKGAALSAPYADPTSVAEAILSCAANPQKWQRLSERGLEVVSGELSASETSLPLTRWAAAPTKAPDRDIDWRGLVEDRGLRIFQRISWQFLRTYW